MGTRPTAKTMNTEFCEKYDMFPREGLILCAVSGGKDSMYLLENLRALAPERGFSVACAHFDHRLRGAESDRDRRFVENWCRGHGVPVYVGAGDARAYAEEKKLGVEAAARALRYAFLEKTADETGAARIATAHTADDNVETLLLNLTRGAGLKGLCGIPPVRGRFIRPMLTVTAAEVLEWLAKNEVPHVEDSTNGADGCARNIVRHRVIPVLRELNAGFDAAAARCIENLRGDEAYLDALAEAFLQERRNGNEISASAFAVLPGPVSARVLQRMTPQGLSAAQIKAVQKLAAGENAHGDADVPGLRVTRDRDRLLFGASESVRIQPRLLHTEETITVPEADLTVSCEFIKNCTEIHNSFNNFCFKSDSICDTITIRSRLEGDKIRLNGRKCTKTLKKLFSEANLNGTARNAVPVLCDGKGPVAVGGFGIAERCVPRPGDDVLHVTLRPLKQKNTFIDIY